MASIDLIPGFESFSVNEAKLSKVHRAAKKGSYPAVIVVVQDGKVIHQEPVSTPEVAPATFNVMQKKYPKALLHLEDKTGKRLFSESVVTEDNDTIDNLNSMANTDLERIGDYADMIKDRMSQGQTLDAWMYSKISDSVKNLNSVHDTMDGNDGIDEAEKHEFNPNETAERLKRREQQNIERFRAAQDREDPFAIEYYQLRISIDKLDIKKLQYQTKIHQLKQKYKK
tara:strand:- start:842 stop:1522 length:681 start_codon:yes stop_codon:yes gene_type:complete